MTTISAVGANQGGTPILRYYTADEAPGAGSDSGGSGGASSIASAGPIPQITGPGDLPDALLLVAGGGGGGGAARSNVGSGHGGGAGGVAIADETSDGAGTGARGGGQHGAGGGGNGVGGNGAYYCPGGADGVGGPGGRAGGSGATMWTVFGDVAALQDEGGNYYGRGGECKGDTGNNNDGVGGGGGWGGGGAVAATNSLNYKSSGAGGGGSFARRSTVDTPRGDSQGLFWESMETEGLVRSGKDTVRGAVGAVFLVPNETMTIVGSQSAGYNVQFTVGNETKGCNNGCTFELTPNNEDTVRVVAGSTSGAYMFAYWMTGPCEGSGSPVCNVPVEPGTRVEMRAKFGMN